MLDKKFIKIMNNTKASKNRRKIRPEAAVLSLLFRRVDRIVIVIVIVTAEKKKGRKRREKKIQIHRLLRTRTRLLKVLIQPSKSRQEGVGVNRNFEKKRGLTRTSLWLWSCGIHFIFRLEEAKTRRKRREEKT